MARSLQRVTFCTRLSVSSSASQAPASPSPGSRRLGSLCATHLPVLELLSSPTHSAHEQSSPGADRGRALPPPPFPCPCPSLSFSRFCLRNPGTAGPTRTVPRALRGEQVSGASPHFLRLGGEADSVPRIPAASPCPGDGSRRAPPGRARAATSLTSQSPAAGHGRPPGATPPGSLCGPRGGGRGRGRRSGWRCRGADVRIRTLPARAAPSKQRERREQRPGTGRAQASGGRGRGGRRT